MKPVRFTLMLVILLFIGSVNATYIDEISTDNINDIQYFENDSVVGLNGFNFTIPEGFGLIENESIDSAGGNYTPAQRFFANGEGDVIMISTASIVRHDLILSDYTPCDVDMARYSIGGHDGIEWSMDNASYFIYFDGDYLITVGTSDSSLLEEIIR